MVEELRSKIIEVIEKEFISYLILNLQYLIFMDSSGLGVILGRYKQVYNNGGEMVVCVIFFVVECLFNMLGLFKIICFEFNEENVF